jgi:hypothetical protein
MITNNHLKKKGDSDDVIPPQLSRQGTVMLILKILIHLLLLFVQEIDVCPIFLVMTRRPYQGIGWE